MDRKDAIILANIYKIELKRGRGVYTGDIIAEHVLPAGRCKKQMEMYKDQGYLEESSLRGSNVYNLSVAAKQHVNAYRDLRLEILRAV